MSDQAPVAFIDVTSLGSLRRSLGDGAQAGLEPYPGVRVLLEALRRDGVRPAATASSDLATREQLIELLEHHALDDLIAPELTIAR